MVPIFMNKILIWGLFGKCCPFKLFGGPFWFFYPWKSYKLPSPLKIPLNFPSSINHILTSCKEIAQLN